MNQVFTGTVIKLRSPKTATIELTFVKIHPIYHKPQNIVTTKEAHYEVTEKEIINWLTQYFQENNIKEINLKNSELVVIYDNNEIASLGKIIKEYELWNIKDYLVKTEQSSLTAEKLKKLGGSDFSKTELPLKLGDKVKIKSCRPLSKTKRFLVIEQERRIVNVK